MADHTDHAASGSGEHHGVGHVVPLKLLVATGLALLVLTVITVWVARFDFGAANVFVAMAIATVKASLVVLLFMHLLWDRSINSFILIASIAFVGLFIAFALTDTVEYGPDLVPGNGSAIQTQLEGLETP